MRIAILRFDAPLMSFGGVLVDQHGPTERFPGLSLLAGLFSNALGYGHGDYEALESLQRRIEYAARWDMPPQPIIDYHTVDLGQPKMRQPGWTTRGEPEHRAGGESARLGTHQRYRHYWANGVMTLAVSLKGSDKPDTSELGHALQQPARPLFIGRKACLPSSPLFLEEIDAKNVLLALESVLPARRPNRNTLTHMEACWPIHAGDRHKSKRIGKYDSRDWRNQIHTGRRTRIEGLLEVKA